MTRRRTTGATVVEDLGEADLLAALAWAARVVRTKRIEQVTLGSHR